ncbi:MAG: hypothetical protein ACUVWA_08305 [Candidatus Oleimicrobiaceae bacterium]
MTHRTRLFRQSRTIAISKPEKCGLSMLGRLPALPQLAEVVAPQSSEPRGYHDIAETCILKKNAKNSLILRLVIRGLARLRRLQSS